VTYSKVSCNLPRRPDLGKVPKRKKLQQVSRVIPSFHCASRFTSHPLFRRSAPASDFLPPRATVNRNIAMLPSHNSIPHLSKTNPTRARAVCHSLSLSLSRYEMFPASEPSWWQAGLRMGRISLHGRRSDRSRSACTIKTAYIRYPPLRDNQLRRLRTCTYLLRKALALSSSLAVRRVTRLQQVPIVTCCASKRHRCLIPSIITSHPAHSHP
jgi:hypothetical protein